MDATRTNGSSATGGRVAVVHDYLSQFGGAERVALALADLFDAPIFTSLYQPDLTFADFREREVHTTYLQRVVPEGRFRLAGPLLGKAFERVDLSGFDQVVVSTSGFAHHVHHDNAFVYCHTPPRFIYDIDTYFSSSRLITATKPFLPWLRRNDQRAAKRHEHYVANSRGTAARIQNIYGKSAPVIHPPLRTEHLPVELTGPTRQGALVIARLQPYKRIDVAIAACAAVGIPLTIAGTGIDEARLRSLAGPDVTFLGRVEDALLPELFRTHSVVLAPGIEDFGLAPVEANYAGRPVLAVGAGGALETMVDGESGKIVDGDDIGAWAQALGEALNTRWDPEALRARTIPFQMPAFRSRIEAWVAPAAPR